MKKEEKNIKITEKLIKNSTNAELLDIFAGMYNNDDKFAQYYNEKSSLFNRDGQKALRFIEDEILSRMERNKKIHITDLLVTAEDVQTGERVTGYVCGCKQCRTAWEYEDYDHSRPIGLLTHPEQEYGNVRVYTDTLELVNNNEKR